MKSVDQKRKESRARTKDWYAENREHALAWHKNRRRTHPQVYLLKEARKRAKNKGLAFSLTIEDVVLPSFCPVLGIALSVGEGVCHDGSPTIDRIKGERGYVPGNVVVISSRANRIKNDATLEEIRAVLRFYESLS